jgi:hypothetical protein
MSKKNKQSVPPKPGYRIENGEYVYKNDDWGVMPSKKFLKDKSLQLHEKILRLFINKGVMSVRQVARRIGSDNYKSVAEKIRDMRREEFGAYDLEDAIPGETTADNTYRLRRVNGKAAFRSDIRNAFHTQAYVDLKGIKAKDLSIQMVLLQEKHSRLKRKYRALKARLNDDSED